MNIKEICIIKIKEFKKVHIDKIIYFRHVNHYSYIFPVTLSYEITNNLNVKIDIQPDIYERESQTTFVIT